MGVVLHCSSGGGVLTCSFFKLQSWIRATCSRLKSFVWDLCWSDFNGNSGAGKSCREILCVEQIEPSTVKKLSLKSNPKLAHLGWYLGWHFFCSWLQLLQKPCNLRASRFLKPSFLWFTFFFSENPDDPWPAKFIHTWYSRASIGSSSWLQ